MEGTNNREITSALRTPHAQLSAHFPLPLANSQFPDLVLCTCLLIPQWEIMT